MRQILAGLFATVIVPSALLSFACGSPRFLAITVLATSIGAGLGSIRFWLRSKRPARVLSIRPEPPAAASAVVKIGR
jgi:hypothetical protein